MKKRKAEELMDAIGQIDESLIAEAEQAGKAEGAANAEDARRAASGKKGHVFRWALGTAAAAALVLVALPNMSASIAYAWEKVPVLSTIVKVAVWRDYNVDEGGYHADVDVPRVTVEPGGDVAERVGGAAPGQAEGSTSDASSGQAGDDTAVQDKLEQSVEQINASVEELTDRIIAEFEAGKASDPDLEGKDSIDVSHEVVTDTDGYFCLKVMVTEVMGSGWEKDYYYTIDRGTGEIVALSDLFEDDGYVEAVSAEIKKQMRAQMDADEEKIYWLDDEEVPDWNFKEIAADQDFYINSDGKLVICFDEGDVAPMYMGCCEFEMPESVWSAK